MKLLLLTASALLLLRALTHLIANVDVDVMAITDVRVRKK